MGHGNATAALSYGDNDDYLGYLLGDPPGEDGKAQGIAQMFDMMNEERMYTALSGRCFAAYSYYQALAYSKERDQHYDAGFYKGKIASARFYVLNELPQIFITLEVFKTGDTSCLDLPQEILDDLKF